MTLAVRPAGCIIDSLLGVGRTRLVHSHNNEREKPNKFRSLRVDDMLQSLLMVKSTVGQFWNVKIRSLIIIRVIEITGITRYSLEITCHE